MPKKESSITKTKTKKKSKIINSGKAIPKIEMSMHFTEVQQKAFDIFINRQSKNKQGDDFSDWLQAEEEIKSKYKTV